MTGFGRASFEVDGIEFTLEMRSLNHRFLDPHVRLPRFCSSLEGEVRERLKQRFARGKVDVVLSTPGGGAPASSVEVDPGAVEEYVRAAGRLHQSHDVGGTLDVATLLTLPGVARFVDARPDEDSLRGALLAAVEEAASAVVAMRGSEGAALERELQGRLDRVDELARSLESRAGEVQEAVRESLRKRMEKLARDNGLLDEARLYQEVALAADRLDVTEEIVRLRSHVEQFRAVLSREGESVGRRLDFLLQEMVREANTMGSKAGDAPIAHQVVELKTEIERLREQVQNIE